MSITVKPINFKFNDYLSKGYEFLKANFGNIFLAVIFCIIMAIIPFCAMLGMGNLYNYLRKLRKGENVGAGDIFNFDNFTPYFILQLIIIGGVLVLYIPLAIIMFATQQNGEPSVLGSVLLFPYLAIMYIIIFAVVLKGFYMPALISLGGVKDVKTAWNMSKLMTKGNIWNILLFSIVVGFLSQLGIIACGIGILLTMPYSYTANYFAFEDAMQQIEHDEIQEIGLKNEY